MAKIKMILLSITIAALLPCGALAGSYVKLGGTKKASSFQLLGKDSKKKKTVLKLGNLRTEDAQLPPGKLSLSGRMKLRAQQALQRQNAISRAKRPAPKHEVDHQEEEFIGDGESREVEVEAPERGMNESLNTSPEYQ